MSPNASATIKGNQLYPDLFGTVLFYQLPYGVLVNAQFSGLPTVTENGRQHFLGFHIHEYGDLPPILNCNGYAWQSFLTDKFTVSEILGRSVIVHASADDFMTQPSGNSGAKIGCGIIN